MKPSTMVSPFVGSEGLPAMGLVSSSVLVGRYRVLSGLMIF